MANTVEVVGGLGSATDSDVLVGVTYTSDNGIKRSGTFSPTATNVSYDNTSSGLSGTSVQAAIDELFSDKADAIHNHDSDYDTKGSANSALEAAQLYTDAQIAAIPTPDVSGQIADHNADATSHADIRDEIAAIVVPTKVSELTNDKGYITDYIETDPTVPAWAKAATKPAYTADEVGADVKGSANEALEEAKGYTDTKVSGLISANAVDAKIDTHNTSTSSHNDIRDLINGLTTRLNTLADSDDTTLDQMSEVVAYIKSNKGLIDTITTSKVSVSDIIDNLTTNISNKPLSAAQGVALKVLIDAISKESIGLGNVENKSSATIRDELTKENVTSALGYIPLDLEDAYVHPVSGVKEGTYKSVTVDANGHVIGGTNPTTLAEYGITDAEQKGSADEALASAKQYTDSAITQKSQVQIVTWEDDD